MEAQLVFFKNELKGHFDERTILSMWRMIDEDLVKKGHEIDLAECITKLKNNVPVQYITQTQYFFEYPFFVNEHVLIPRPETEELVDYIYRNNYQDSQQVLDIGTGSGCIPIIIKLKNKLWNVQACDVSEEALKVAKKNAENLHAEVDFFKMDILQDSLQESFDIIVSNPPYVLESFKDKMEAHVLREPHLALFVSDEDGLLFYKKIIRLAEQGLLRPLGHLFFEINEFLVAELIDFCEKETSFSINVIDDMQGLPRIAHLQFD